MVEVRSMSDTVMVVMFFPQGCAEAHVQVGCTVLKICCIMS